MAQDAPPSQSGAFTFPASWDLPQKPVLSTICQLAGQAAAVKPEVQRVHFGGVSTSGEGEAALEATIIVERLVAIAPTPMGRGPAVST
jgi:hypothetical protein